MLDRFVRPLAALALLILAFPAPAAGALQQGGGMVADAIRLEASVLPDTVRVRAKAPVMTFHLELAAEDSVLRVRPALAGHSLPPAVIQEITLPDAVLQRPPLLFPPSNHLLRSAGALGGAGVVTFGIIWLLPEEYSKWDKTAGPEGFRPGWSSFKQAFTRPPVWDEDGWLVNYVGHPLTGMYTYLLERNYGSSPTRSFLFSTAASFGWEYLVESWAEQPSIQDLLVTSTLGSVLGELNYRATQQLRRGGLSDRDKVVLTILNPVHVLQHGYR